MSMLAERKRKAKWIIHSSKKPLWDTDSEGIKFGKGLMEKMGWSAGKGLGVNEQGITEPLKVSHKVDTKGVGYKGNEENWTKQQDEFDNLLSQLSNSVKSNKNSEEFSKLDVKSLEEKSKKSRARVHYQKFTRGKDLSRYNEKDLACILGTSKLMRPNNDNKEKENEPEIGKTDNSSENNFGFKTINSGSIEDYFKKKWLDRKKSKNIDNLQNNLQLKDQYCGERFHEEGLSNASPSHNCTNLGTENQETQEKSESIEKSVHHTPENESAEEKHLEKYLYRKKKRKNHQEEFPEKTKKSKKKKSENGHSIELPKTEKIISCSDSNNLLIINQNTEYDNDSCKIRSKNLITDYQIDEENIKKGKKLKIQNHKEAEINSKNEEKTNSVNASELIHYNDNNFKQTHVKKKRKDKQKSKEKDEESKKKENENSKKYEKFDTDKSEKISDNETPKSEISKEGRKKNKKILEAEDICDKNELSLECNSDEISNERKHKKSKKNGSKKKVKNEEGGSTDHDDGMSNNKNSNLKSAREGVLGNQEESEVSEINNIENMGTLNHENFVDKHESKEILKKNKSELGSEDNNFPALLPPNKNIMYSVHSHKKKLNYSKIIKLTYGASIDKFIGSNLLGLPGYGTLSKNKNVNAKAT